MQKINLVALQTSTTRDFEANLQNIKTKIESVSDGSIILAPELALSSYSYDNMDAASDISNKSIEIFKQLSQNKSIGVTLTYKESDEYFNAFVMFSKGEIIHFQPKSKLFTLSDEEVYFTAGSDSMIKIFEVDGIKIGVLICFELRFLEFWSRLRGADLILVPAMWGGARKKHFHTLTNSLAIMNQCYVLASCSSDYEYSRGSGIITPFGEEFRDDSKVMISHELDLNEIKKMRRTLYTGLRP